jgi:hypothetical protein
MKNFVNVAIAFTIVLTSAVAFADPFSTTIQAGSTITGVEGDPCGGSTDVYNVALPASCMGDIDTSTGNITISSCTFSPSTDVPGFIITLSANSGSGNYDGTTLSVTPDINVNVTDNPAMFINCDSATPISAPLSGPVDPVSGGTISFSGSIPGPTFVASGTCPALVAGALNCRLQTVTAASLNVTIP